VVVLEERIGVVADASFQPPEYQFQLTPASVRRSPMVMLLVAVWCRSGSLFKVVMVGVLDGNVVLTA